MAIDLANAAWEGNLTEVRRRLDAGEPVNGADGSGNPLIYAAYQGQYDIAKLLVERGADLTLRESSGKSAEDHAREKSHLNILNLLQDEALRRKGPQEAWVKMGAATVAFVGAYPELNRKITTIFNFETRDRLIVTENLKTKAETSPATTCFDELPRSAVEKAFNEFTRLGGEADRSFVLDGAESLGKGQSKGLHATPPAHQ